jgi:hypothetical protein
VKTDVRSHIFSVDSLKSYQHEITYSVNTVNACSKVATRALESRVRIEFWA